MYPTGYSQADVDAKGCHDTFVLLLAVAHVRATLVDVGPVAYCKTFSQWTDRVKRIGVKPVFRRSSSSFSTFISGSFHSFRSSKEYESFSDSF